MPGAVSSEVPQAETAALTVRVLHPGTKENVIAEDATLKLNIRTFTDAKDYTLSALKCIFNTEGAASNGPKEPEQMGLDSYPLTENEPQATAKVAAAFKTEFGEKAHAIKPTTASEGFSVFGRRKVP